MTHTHEEASATLRREVEHGRCDRPRWRARATDERLDPVDGCRGEELLTGLNADAHRYILDEHKRAIDLNGIRDGRVDEGLFVHAPSLAPAPSRAAFRQPLRRARLILPWGG